MFLGADSSDQIQKQPPRASAQLRRVCSSSSLTQPRHELHRAHLSLHGNPCTSCGQATFLLCSNKSRCSKTPSGVSGGPSQIIPGCKQLLERVRAVFPKWLLQNDKFYMKIERSSGADTFPEHVQSLAAAQGTSSCVPGWAIQNWSRQS